VASELLEQADRGGALRHLPFRDTLFPVVAQKDPQKQPSSIGRPPRKAAPVVIRRLGGIYQASDRRAAPLPTSIVLRRIIMGTSPDFC